MKIGINASFARKGSTGIGQVTLNFLHELSKLKIEGARSGASPFLSGRLKDFEFVLYLEHPLPRNFIITGNFDQRVFLPAWKRDDLVRKIWWEKYLLPRKVKADKCDVFVSLYQSATILPKGTRHVMVVHDIIPKLFPEYLDNFRKKIYWNLTEKAMRSADKIVAVSRRTEKDLVQNLGIDPSRISVSYIDVGEDYKKDTSESESLRVMKKYSLTPGYIYTGGGLEKRKNTQALIRAYKILLDKNKKERFVNTLPKLVVSGKLLPGLAPLVLDVEKMVRKMNLCEQVKILDFIPQEDLPALYKNAIFFVYPSSYEGFGLPVLESMNQGTPVIAAKTSSLPEVGGDGILYCDSGDVSDLVMTMKNALLNKKLRETLSVRGKDRARKFSMSGFAEKILNIASERDI